ncbi:oxidative stress-responsive serine-rich protein 1 [Lepisosteus oculatus]|uniref:oxidative stress-responsive serine-rich protein 1 n=1 Tax=Lepisosteus oculatus TaxID=7918 RepID=UPI0035F51B28
MTGARTFYDVSVRSTSEECVLLHSHCEGSECKQDALGGGELTKPLCCSYRECKDSQDACPQHGVRLLRPGAAGSGVRDALSGEAAADSAVQWAWLLQRAPGKSLDVQAQLGQSGGPEPVVDLTSPLRCSSVVFSTMEPGAKDPEEETLQTAFKKLRVDAEGSTAAVRVCDSTAQRMAARGNPDGAKPKTACPKENWHGCMRKTSRGAARSQRRRRSKSPILHPPKFTYCSSKMSPPPGHLKHKSQPEPDGDSTSLGIPAKKELLSPGRCSPVFGATTYEPYGHESSAGAAALEINPKPVADDEAPSVSKSPGCALCPERTSSGSGPPSDFQSLSKLHEAGGCPCLERQCQCHSWQGVEVYSFTGLRDVISECERNMAGTEDTSRVSPRHRTQGGAAASGSPRSCSEQARAYVDDITIEDLSGYMEYYLYFPKKMSHMAEMMYT